MIFFLRRSITVNIFILLLSILYLLFFIFHILVLGKLLLNFTFKLFIFILKWLCELIILLLFIKILLLICFFLFYFFRLWVNLFLNNMLKFILLLWLGGFDLYFLTFILISKRCESIFSSLWLRNYFKKWLPILGRRSFDFFAGFFNYWSFALALLCGLMFILMLILVLFTHCGLVVESIIS